MGTRPRGLVLVTIASLLLLLLSSDAAAGSCYRYRAPERRLAHLTNRARRHHGLRALRLDRHLSRVARVHTVAMARDRTLYHTPSRTLGWRVTRWRVLGENVGYGPRVRALQRAFMHSSGHRANILRRGFRHVGVGSVRTAGHLWVTVVFEARRNPGTRLRMPSC